jgi:hypothetical protein
MDSNATVSVRVTNKGAGLAPTRARLAAPRPPRRHGSRHRSWARTLGWRRASNALGLAVAPAMLQGCTWRVALTLRV